ncbi:glycosyltransferase family 2 protein [Candidatus Omnitrophota bacterium]
MSVSIIMPCYNEAAFIEKVVRNYYEAIISKISDSELIVVDDCSHDNSLHILNSLQTEYPKLKVLRTASNSGHGRAIRTGYENATKKYIFQVDSDDQFDANDFWKFYDVREDYDFVLGVRKDRSDPPERIVLSWVVNAANFLVFGIWMKDSNCPFRLMKKEITDTYLKMIPNDAIAPNLMLSLIAKKNRAKMLELPVSHFIRNGTPASSSTWKLTKLALKGFTQLLKWRIPKEE